MYVIHGENCEKVGLTEATWHEYFAALFRMSKDTAVPHAWKEPMLEHQHQLATMAATWEWETCRLWSERMFSMIDDGRLPNGWADPYAIKDVQRDACAVGTRLGAKQQHRASYSGGWTNTPTPNNSDNKTDDNKDTDGKPCHLWNWGNDCGFTASHGQHPTVRRTSADGAPTNITAPILTKNVHA